MSQPTSKFRFQPWLIVVIAFAFIMAGCCPPALLEHPVAKNDKTVAAEKKNP